MLASFSPVPAFIFGTPATFYYHFLIQEQAAFRHLFLLAFREELFHPNVQRGAKMVQNHF